MHQRRENRNSPATPRRNKNHASAIRSVRVTTFHSEAYLKHYGPLRELLLVVRGDRVVDACSVYIRLKGKPLEEALIMISEMWEGASISFQEIPTQDPRNNFQNLVQGRLTSYR